MKNAYYDLGRTRVVCDNCGKALYFEGTDFTQINQKLRSAGWAVVNKGDEWHDFCGNVCKDKFKFGKKINVV